VEFVDGVVEVGIGGCGCVSSAVCIVSVEGLGGWNAVVFTVYVFLHFLYSSGVVGGVGGRFSGTR